MIFIINYQFQNKRNLTLCILSEILDKGISENLRASVRIPGASVRLWGIRENFWGISDIFENLTDAPKILSAGPPGHQ